MVSHFSSCTIIIVAVAAAAAPLIPPDQMEATGPGKWLFQKYGPSNVCNNFNTSSNAHKHIVSMYIYALRQIGN